MSNDFPDIPDFLRAENSAKAKLTPEQEEWLKDWLGRVRPSRRCRQRFDLPKNIEPAGRALLKQIEKDKKERQRERIKELRERHGR